MLLLAKTFNVATASTEFRPNVNRTVVLCVATTNTPLQECRGYAVGGVVVAAGSSFGPISGGPRPLNPAATLAATVGN